MCAFAPRHAASAANRHKGGLGSPPKMLHESSSTKSWQFMAVNHSVYLVLGWAMLLHGYSAMALRTSLFKKREIPRSWTHFSPHHGADQKQLLSFKFSTKLYIPSILFVSLFVTGATHSAGLGYAATWLFCYGSAHKSFQKERDPKIMDSFFTTPWCGSKAVIKFQVQHSNHQNRLFVCFNAGFCFNPG